MGLFSSITSGIKSAVSSVTTKARTLISSIPIVSKIAPALGAGVIAASVQSAVNNVPVLKKIQDTATKYNVMQLNPVSNVILNKVIKPITGYKAGPVASAKGIITTAAPGATVAAAASKDVLTTSNAPGTGGIISDIGNYVKENPVKSGLIAAGVVAAGAVAYSVLKKKKKTSPAKKSKSKKRKSTKYKKKSKSTRSKRKHYGTSKQYARKGGKVVHRTKNGQPYIILANGRARFIKK